jgi:hypothetical protein
VPNFITETDGLDIYFSKISEGGHCAAWEQPALLVAELRSAFDSLR